MNNYTLVTKQADLCSLIESLLCEDIIALDTETTGLCPRRDHIRLLQIATNDGCWLIDRYGVSLAHIWPYLVGKTCVMHNSLFDLQFLATLGFEPTKIYDTMLASQVLYCGTWVAGEIAKQTSLKTCAIRELGIELDKTHQASDWGGQLTPEMLTYAARDAAVLLPLQDALARKLEEANLTHVSDLEFRAARAVAWASFHGIGFDIERWTTLCEEARREAEALVPQLEAHVPESYRRQLRAPINWNSRAETLRVLRDLGLDFPDANNETLEEVSSHWLFGSLILQWRNARRWKDEEKLAWLSSEIEELMSSEYLVSQVSPINWHSTQQKAAILAELGVQLPCTAKGSPRVDDTTLAEIDHPLAVLLRKYSDACKRAERVGWLEFADGGRLYPSWHQCGTETGRMSASKPPLQQVNRTAGHRSCFVAPPGRVLIKADYNAIEMRITAIIANEPEMVEAFANGSDIHVRTATIFAAEQAITSMELLCMWAGVPPNRTGAEVLRYLWTGKGAGSQEARLARTYGKARCQGGGGERWEPVGGEQLTVEGWCSAAEIAGVPGELVREVREYQVSGSAPQGSRPDQQYPLELRDALSILPYVGTRTLEELTAGGSLGETQRSWKELRQLAKAVGFGLNYGMGARKLGLYSRVNYGVEMSDDEAEWYHKVFFRAYPALRRWQRWQGNSGQAVVFTRLGRRRLLIQRSEEESFFTRRLNTPVQGTGADGLKTALALLYERRAECLDAVPVLFAHDEVVVECDEDQREATEAWLRQAMVDGMQPLVEPVEAIVETQWGYDWAGRKER